MLLSVENNPDIYIIQKQDFSAYKKANIIVGLMFEDIL
jgi:hypothetical protein